MKEKRERGNDKIRGRKAARNNEILINLFCERHRGDSA